MTRRSLRRIRHGRQRAEPCLLVTPGLGGQRSRNAVELIAADPAAREPTALDGTVIRVSGPPGAQVLMRLTAGRIARLPGAPRASYRSIDLGRDGRGAPVLGYRRCLSGSCARVLDDLRGSRRLLRGLEPPGCHLTAGPVLWRTLAACGLSCANADGFTDAQGSAPYVRGRSGVLRRPRLPAKTAAFGISHVGLDGTRASEVAADLYAHAFIVGVDGRGLQPSFATASEGEVQQSVGDIALGFGGVPWTLVLSEATDEPPATHIYRLDDSCMTIQPAGPRPSGDVSFLVIDLALDGAWLVPLAPSRRIVGHALMPRRPCLPIQTR